MLSGESIVFLLWLQRGAWAMWIFTTVLWLYCVSGTLFTLCYDVVHGQWEFPLWRRSGCGVVQFLPEAEPALTLTLVLFFGVMSSFICSSFSRQQLRHLGTWTHWAASTRWEVSFSIRRQVQCQRKEEKGRQTSQKAIDTLTPFEISSPELTTPLEWQECSATSVDVPS